jgi:hypothetical protein
VNLSQLVHSTKRLEREAKRAGILAEPPPPPLSDQEQAEHDRLTALVDAHATEHEKATLDFSAMAGVGVQFGWRLTDLAAAASGEELERPLPPFEWNPSVLVEVTARIELRRELRLPRRECVLRNVPQEASYCLCLSEAIDAAIASGQPTTRDEVLKAARRAHGERWAWLKRKPKPRPEPPRTESVKARISPPPRPVPAAAVSETNTKPARVVKRTPKWFDEPGRRSIMDMKF